MKNFFYILLIAISACSPDTDYQLLEESTSTETQGSMNLEGEPQSNLDTDSINNEINMMVNSSTVNCRGEMEGTCLLVQEGDMIGTENWENFYYHDGIKGFTYEPGFIYGLKVKKTEVQTSVASGSTLRYELEKIVSKEAQETTAPQNATVISNVSELIAGLKSDANLYLLPGTYTINSTINLRNIYNLNIVGADGVLIKGNLVNLIQFEEKAQNITFKNIGFNSTSSAKGLHGGLVYFNQASAENILFDGCSFTCPNTDTNGLQFVSQGSFRSKRIEIINCEFENIGRMAIETINHNGDDIVRIEDVIIKNNNFNNLGTASPYGMAISLSGTGRNATLSGNTIIDAKTHGIENVAWSDVVIQNNTFSFTKNSYNPISMGRRAGGSQYMTGVSITGNSGTVSGNDSHLIELNNCDGLEYSKNSIYADALHLNDVKNSSFTNNFHSSDGGIGLFVENKSNSNTFFDNTLITTRDYAVTISFFSGATGNTLKNNEVIKKGIGGAKFVDQDGGNINLDQTN